MTRMSRLLCMTTGLLLGMGPFAPNGSPQVPAQPAKDRPAKGGPGDLERVKKLVEQLSSPTYAEREAATKSLERIGTPALTALRQAAVEARDLETRRRLESLIQAIANQKWNDQFKEAVRQEKAKDYRKAVQVFEELAQQGVRKWRSEKRTRENWDDPVLSDVFVHLARCYRGLEDYAKAGDAYRQAAYYANYNAGQREMIAAEQARMIAGLITGWEKAVRHQAGQDPVLKALIAKYPLVTLHSRRFAGGGYLQSAYSFNYETAEEAKHRNDVQLLFENGNPDSCFALNMVVGQQNLIVDLGTVDFTQNHDPRKVDITSENTWVPGDCKAIPGHVYLERVRDSAGNRFFVALQILAVGKNSEYVSFVWRRLPGGKVVRQH